MIRTSVTRPLPKMICAFGGETVLECCTPKALYVITVFEGDL